MSHGKAKRHVFASWSFEVLQDIIANRENGRFLEIIRDKDVTKNLEKAEIWNAITKYYNQVTTISI
jgi:hypothetical protein